MLDYKQRLDNAMLQLQFIIDEDYEDNDNDNAPNNDYERYMNYLDSQRQSRLLRMHERRLRGNNTTIYDTEEEITFPIRLSSRSRSSRRRQEGLACASTRLRVLHWQQSRRRAGRIGPRGRENQVGGFGVSGRVHQGKPGSRFACPAPRPAKPPDYSGGPSGATSGAELARSGCRGARAAFQPLPIAARQRGRSRFCRRS
mgnify:CR=1 FL=1